MNLIIYLIAGAIVGYIASRIMRTNSQQGIVVGVVGAFLAGYLISPLLGVGRITDAITLPTLLVTLLGSVALLWIFMVFFQRIFGKKQKDNDRRSELLKTIDVYYEAMHFLATIEYFDAANFERLDTILSRAGVSFGPSKRQEMISQAAIILPTKTTGGVGELHVQLQDTLVQASEAFMKILVESYPTPETARQVQKIIAKYKI